jgi:predicted short-subunit dehydrogenase-like oxidoreductase (DUF2520 family)
MTSPLQQKIKISGPVVITANRTSDGAVVYRGAAGHWTTALVEAIVATTAEQAGDLLRAASADNVEVVGPYIAPVKRGDDGIVPGNLRELIRLRGPTIDLPVTFGI